MPRKAVFRSQDYYEIRSRNYLFNTVYIDRTKFRWEAASMKKLIFTTIKTNFYDTSGTFIINLKVAM